MLCLAGMSTKEKVLLLRDHDDCVLVLDLGGAGGELGHATSLTSLTFPSML